MTRPLPQAQLSGGLGSYRCETVIIPGRLHTTESVIIESAWEIACLISGWHVYFTRIVQAHHSSAMVESNAPVSIHPIRVQWPAFDNPHIVLCDNSKIRIQG